MKYIIKFFLHQFVNLSIHQFEYFLAPRTRQWLEELFLLFQTFIGVDIKQGPLFATFIRGGRQFMWHRMIQIQMQIQTQTQMEIQTQMHIQIQSQMLWISNKFFCLLFSLEGGLSLCDTHCTPALSCTYQKLLILKSFSNDNR